MDSASIQLLFYGLVVAALSISTSVRPGVPVFCYWPAWSFSPCLRLNFTTLVSGPIQRYDEFLRNQFAREPLPLGPRVVGRRLERIVIGFFKVNALAAVLLVMVYPFSANCSGYVVTFFLVGIRHGRTSEFVVFGILTGGGVSANKLWQLWLTHGLGRKGHKNLGNKPIYIALSRGLYFSWFAFTLLWFWGDWKQIDEVFSP